MSTMLRDITKSSVAMYNSGLLILKKHFYDRWVVVNQFKMQKMNRKLHFYD